MREYRGLRLRIQAGATLRTGMFEEREHIVVPVVMLVEGVLHAVNSPNPELVLASEFSKAPSGWNGRPVMLDHPNDGVTQISANSPTVLAARIGSLFNTEAKDNKLASEAWIDPVRCSEQTLARVRSGAAIEVSVGAFINAEAASGVVGGKDYKAIWREIVPDHLAFLPEGAEGACSVAMGCGAPRAARVYITTPGGLEEVPVVEELKRSLRERLGALLRFRTEEGPSDSEIRSRISDAIRKDEPGYMWIEAVFQSDSTVVYAVQPENEILMFRRGFTLSGSDVTLAKKKEEVKAEMSFVPAAAATELAASCSCGGHTPPTAASPHIQEPGDDMNKEARIAALIAALTNSFTEADRPFLLALPDERLAAFEAAPVATPEAVPAPVAAAPVPAAAPAPVVAETPAEPVTAAAYIAAAPADIREVLTAGLRAAETKKATTIAALTAGGKCPFTEAELKAKSQDELDKLAQLAGSSVVAAAADFSGRAPRAASADDANVVPPPPNMNERVRALAKSQSN